MNNRPSCYLMEGCAAIREVQANQLSYVQNMAAKAKPRSTKAERVPTHPVHVFSAEGEEHLRRVRHICSGLPNTTEKLSHGSPTFFHKKVYCRFTQNVEKRVAVWIPVPPGEQSALIRSAPAVYFRPPYVGVYGWVGIMLDRIDDEELAVHLHEAWKMMGALTTPSRNKVGNRDSY
jgi:hypothetical protein